MGTATQSTDPADTRAARDGETPNEAPAPRAVLTAERLRQYKSKKLHWVPMPEVGDGAGVFLPTLTSADRAEFETDNVIEKKHRKGNAVITERTARIELINERLMARFAVDEDGNRLYPFDEPEEEIRIARELSKLPAAAVGRVGDRVSELMGWGEDDLDDLMGN